MTHRILRLPAVIARTGLSRSTIYERINPRSERYDVTFPKQVSLGRSARAVGFVEAEIDVWLDRQIEASRRVVG